MNEQRKYCIPSNSAASPNRVINRSRTSGAFASFEMRPRLTLQLDGFAYLPSTEEWGKYAFSRISSIFLSRHFLINPAEVRVVFLRFAGASALFAARVGSQFLGISFATVGQTSSPSLRRRKVQVVADSTRRARTQIKSLPS